MNNFIPQKVARRETWSQLHGSSITLSIAEFCKERDGVKLIITPDQITSMTVLNELNFFCANNHKNEILYFPDWETLPYDQFSPHQDLISERLVTLAKLKTAGDLIVISSVSTLMHYLSPKEYLNQQSLFLKIGAKLNSKEFVKQLTEAGYINVNKVLEHGEYALRGSIIDIYPMGSKLPFRIELFDDEIESLRTFSPEDQKTIAKINEINLLPAKEFPLTDTSIKNFRQKFRETFAINPLNCPIYEAISNGRFPNGIEYYLPLFFDSTGTFFDYLPDNSHICLVGETNKEAEKFTRETQNRYKQRSVDITRPILEPSLCFLSQEVLFAKIDSYPVLHLYQQKTNKKGSIKHFDIKPSIELLIDRKAELPLYKLKDFITKTPNRVLLAVESKGRREVMLDLLHQTGIVANEHPSWDSFIEDDSHVNIMVAPISEGAELKPLNITIIVESQIFGMQSIPQRKASKKVIDADLIVKDLAELQIGAPVVHIDFGVGRYLGLQTLNTGDVNEYLVISYAGGDKIYVPVTSLHLITRYTGSNQESAPLNKLGTDTWSKAKAKAQEKINDIAVELLSLYAARNAKPGFEYRFDKNEYIKFKSEFPFIDTEDQQRAIEQVIDDMQSSKPMDRLICGDVGFGKTEVAMRAAFIAVQNDAQVCVLAPTTLLAGQHFETFRDRFAEYPVNIELLSRFRSAKESAKVIAKLQNGTVDIVIGTHKLLQKGIKFKNLKLLVIDEEHRFGVKQKEQIKSLRTNLDILSMTATPIPRTLNMAMTGIRDISLITTPPAKRLAIKTFWQEHNNSIIREAILREILRGGQVFFVHNDVQTIAATTQKISELVPEALVKNAHGQMPERELEKQMSDFYHQKFNVLICTTIIETGIDIPTANTIIINKADRFGLAQLHQLRGRVGRSHHQAYAYLLTANEKLLTRDAIKRLEAIVSLEELGAGFTLATHDLEIRGAGEILGEEQSGNIESIGFTLFMDLLDRAVQDLRQGKNPDLNIQMQNGAEIDLKISAIIPDDYISDVHTRLIMYKRINNAKDSDALKDLQIELIDRFGLLPDSVKNLFKITKLKQLATEIGIAKITGQNQKVKIEFSEKPKINAEYLISLIQNHSTKYKLEGPSILYVQLEKEKTEDKIFEISDVVLGFQSPA